MHELARVIPSDTHLTSVSGTVSPTASSPAGGGVAMALRGSNPGPAIDIVGCADGQSNVSRMMSRLRLIDGVQHVTLAESAKSDAAGGSSGGDSGECRYSASVARFDVLIIFAAPPAVAAPAAPGATPASATTPAPSGSTP
jgi:hypothetical protein